MNKFKVGDRVKVIFANNYPETVGTITTIISDKQQETGYDCWVLDFEVRDGTRAKVIKEYASQCLRKIDDDSKSSSWTKIEELTQWNPTKVAA